MTTIPPNIDGTRLYQLLTAAGVALNGLTVTDTQAYTFDAAGNQVDLPAGSDAVIASYTPPPPKSVDLIPIAGQVQTTNATVTQIFRGPLQSGVGYIATLDIIGVLAVAPFDVCVIRASVAAKRTPTGASRIGAAVQLAKHADANAATWTADGTVVGTDFVVTVTGQAAKTINWSLNGSFYRFGPNGLP